MYVVTSVLDAEEGDCIFLRDSGHIYGHNFFCHGHVYHA